MGENLLEVPERGAIEAVLQNNSGGAQAPTFERLLGFLSGAVITPGGFTPSDWLQPLFDRNGVVCKDVEDIERLTASLLALYDRIEAMWLRKESLCPFDLNNVEVVMEPPVLEWATGLHAAVTFQEDIWIPYEDEVDFVDEKLKREVNLNIQSLTTLIDPSSIPDIIKDPVPFQRTVLAHLPGWREDMLRDTWDKPLIEALKMFCLSRLDAIIDSLQRYSTAYDEGDVAVADWQEVVRGPGAD